MISNLRTALMDRHITLRAYADFLGVTEKTVQNKINEVSDFSYPEVKKTMSELLPEYNCDYLFKSDKETN